MGDTDLSLAPGTPALAERIRDGDARAISTFRELHVRQMRAYCEVACSPQLVDEAIAAGFVDFLGRVTESQLEDSELEAALLRATRSAAAGRMPVDSEQPDCWGVPELLAARANDELPGDERTLRDHLGDCPICQETLARMDRAEQAFHPPEAQAEEPSPPDAPRVEETPSPSSEPMAPAAPAPPAPAAAPPPPPAPPAPTPPPPAAAPPLPPAPPPPAPAAPVTVRRRTGGLIGAITKRRRPPLS